MVIKNGLFILIYIIVYKAPAKLTLILTEHYVSVNGLLIVLVRVIIFIASISVSALIIIRLVASFASSSVTSAVSIPISSLILRT